VIEVIGFAALFLAALVGLGLAISERIGRERLIRYVGSATPAEAALLERASKRHPHKKAIEKVVVSDPLEMP
jgi:hypothetical protein